MAACLSRFIDGWLLSMGIKTDFGIIIWELNLNVQSLIGLITFKNIKNLFK